MTLYEFNSLSENSQTDYWASEGRYLARRHTSTHSINLYAVDFFFVETWYEPFTNALQDLQSFSSARQLDAYLQRIKLEML